MARQCIQQYIQLQCIRLCQHASREAVSVQSLIPRHLAGHICRACCALTACNVLQVHAAFHNITAMVGAGVLGKPPRSLFGSWLLTLSDKLEPSRDSVSASLPLLTAFTLSVGLPSAMVYLGWPAGVVIMTLSWVATLYTLYQMCALHEVKGR